MGRVTTVGLLVVIQFRAAAFCTKKITFFTKQAILMRRSTVLSLFPFIKTSHVPSYMVFTQAKKHT
jgi:hypothetical protein